MEKSLRFYFLAVYGLVALFLVIYLIPGVVYEPDPDVLFFVIRWGFAILWFLLPIIVSIGKINNILVLVSGLSLGIPSYFLHGSIFISAFGLVYLEVIVLLIPLLWMAIKVGLKKKEPGEHS
jgi:hypothetical protein